MTKEEAIEILKSNKPTSDPRRCGKELCAACDVAIEALQEPERKKGQWIGDFDHSKYNDWHCSNCGKYYPERNKKLLGDYCPWCGADMRG